MANNIIFAQFCIIVKKINLNVNTYNTTISSTKCDFLTTTLGGGGGGGTLVAFP